MASISLFVGMVVHVTLPNDVRKHRPAIITRIRNEGTLDLHVLTTSLSAYGGASFNLNRVKLCATADIPGTWHLPEAAETRAMLEATPPEPQAAPVTAAHPVDNGVSETPTGTQSAAAAATEGSVTG